LSERRYSSLPSA